LDKRSNNSDKARQTFLFQHLVVMFQALALQQMGKLTSPITGKVERDLHQAKITVDMLEMIQEKTRGNLDDDEKRILDTVIMELQMNYIDETARADDEGGSGGEADEEKKNEVAVDPDADGEEQEPAGDA